MNKEQHNILWNNFRKGDKDAINDLYRKYSHKLYSYGIKISSEDELVKDCIQEVFIQLIEKSKSINITSGFQVYLFKSFRNKLFEELRKDKRNKHILTFLPIETEQCEKSHEQMIVDSEEQIVIRRKLTSIINELSGHQQEIIYLKYTEGFSYEEISKMLSINIASARKLIYRTIKMIKEKLGTGSLFLFIILLKINPLKKTGC